MVVENRDKLSLFSIIEENIMEEMKYLFLLLLILSYDHWCILGGYLCK